MLSEKAKKALIRKIFEGAITTSKLPTNLIEATIKHLMAGVDKGFKDADYPELYKELKKNIYVFSGAKTYAQVKEVSSLILDGKTLRPFSEFKKLALEKYDLYNVTYLESEYNTAVGQAQTAVKWQEIESDKKNFPYLQRKAVMDANTSEECKILNDIIAPVDDPFWRSRSPLTHFNCRCILTKIDRFEDVKLSSMTKINAAIKETEHINPLFKGNPGIDKVIFNKSHPYFEIAKKDKKTFNIFA